MNRSVKQWSRLLIASMAALLLISLPATAGAHQQAGSLALNNVPVGVYRLTMQVSPESIRTGEVHFSASVTDDRGPAANGDIFIQVRPVDHQGPTLFAKARSTAAASQQSYEARLVLSEEGRYQVRVAVHDRVGSGGQAAFVLKVRPSATWLVVLIYSQLLFAPLLGLWLIQQTMRVWFSRFPRIGVR